MAQSKPVQKFLEAAEDGDFMLLKSLLADRPDLINKKNEFGWTALHRASIFRHTTCVKLLLQLGADPNCSDRRGMGPLHKAVFSADRNIPVVILLVDAGANIEARATDGTTPIMLAAENTSLLEFLLLLGMGANLYHKNKLGQSLIDIVNFQLEGVHKHRSYAWQRKDLKLMLEILGTKQELD